MTAAHSTARYFVLRPNVSALVYVALVIISFLIVIFSLIDVGDHYRARNASAAILAQLELRASSPSAHAGGAPHAAPAGSPFVEGQTSTIASAALLQQITGAVVRAGGNVVSSEVDAPSTQAKDAHVKVVVNCELEERALQQLLYEIESGTPFLFVDQLVAQAPTSPGARMRVLLGVAGLWAGAK